MPLKEQHQQETSAGPQPHQAETQGIESDALQALPLANFQPGRSDPRPMTPGDVQRLQRTVGNRATQGLLAARSARSASSIQAKLTVGAPGDAYEQEADSVAARVMQMPGPATGDVQAKPLAASISGLQREAQTPASGRSDGSFDASSDVEGRLAARKGSGSPLPGETQGFMESRFGADFSGVRVHTDGEAAQLNRQLNAQAFTHGQDIYMDAGKYDPGSNAGKQLLAHELTHVVQQGGSDAMRQAVAQRKMKFSSGTQYLDSEVNKNIKSSAFKKVQQEAKSITHEISVEEGELEKGSAKYKHNEDLSGVIVVGRVGIDDKKCDEDNSTSNMMLAAVTHETQHALDDLTRVVKYRQNKDNKIRTEWRAWAREAAVLQEMIDKKKPVPPHKAVLVNSYRDKKSFTDKNSTAFARTRAYLQEYEIKSSPNEEAVLEYMREHDEWLSEAVKLFYDSIEDGFLAHLEDWSGVGKEQLDSCLYKFKRHGTSTPITKEVIDSLIKDKLTLALEYLFRSEEYPLEKWTSEAWSSFLFWNTETEMEEVD